MRQKNHPTAREEDELTVRLGTLDDVRDHPILGRYVIQFLAEPEAARISDSTARRVATTFSCKVSNYRVNTGDLRRTDRRAPGARLGVTVLIATNSTPDGTIYTDDLVGVVDPNSINEY